VACTGAGPLGFEGFEGATFLPALGDGAAAGGACCVGAGAAVLGFEGVGWKSGGLEKSMPQRGGTFA